MQIITNSSRETQELGRELAKQLKPGDIIALEGDLGSGKTELVRGVMLELNSSEIVRSPSFSLVNSYSTPQFKVNHFDFYRLNGSDELFEIGYDEYLNPDSVCFIEWAEMFKDALPRAIKVIRFIDAKDDYRVIETDFDF
jgi:tRNA threonylcarbamoyladenosine biosynthesis protein TsaE